MFDINGGPENVFAFLSIETWYRKYYSAIVFIFGFAVWFTMFYVRYPSLTFWKP